MNDSTNAQGLAGGGSVPQATGPGINLAESGSHSTPESEPQSVEECLACIQQQLDALHDFFAAFARAFL